MEVAEITQSACVKWEEKDQKFLNVPDIKWGSGGNTRKVSKETGQLSPERWDSGLREAEGRRFQKEEWISNSEMAANMGDKEISEDPVESEASEAAGKKTDYTGSESEKRVRSVCMCKQSTDHSSKTFNCS